MPSAAGVPQEPTATGLLAATLAQDRSIKARTKAARPGVVTPTRKAAGRAGGTTKTKSAASGKRGRR